MISIKLSLEKYKVYHNIPDGQPCALHCLNTIQNDGSTVNIEKPVEKWIVEFSDSHDAVVFKLKYGQ
jgi:hypothetical protein